MFSAFTNSLKIPELRSRIFYTLSLLFVSRVASIIPLPGIDPHPLQKFFAEQAASGAGNLIGLYNMFTGGALTKGAIAALGIMPYISASIIFQLMTAVVPALSRLQQEGDVGRQKLTQYTRYATVVICVIQGTLLILALNNPGQLFPGYDVATYGSIVIVSKWSFILTSVIFMTAGTMLLMWLGEQITERGLGNGISILIFAGIAAGLPNAIGGLLELVRTGAMSIIVALFIVALVALVTYFVVFVERGQRKILVNYARRQVGNKVYGGQSSHLPLKLNMAGVIPPIFASSIILLPATVVSWFSTGDSMLWLKDIASALSPGQPVYIMLYVAAIVFFCFFYTALVFNSRETADNLKKSGAFVPGIRPGDQTARYIDKILVRLTLAGAIYIAFVCLLPEFLILKYNVPFYFGGTSLLIIVVVTMDFMAQVQNYMMSQQYESLLKKANFKMTLGG